MSSYAIKTLAKKYGVDYDAALNYADFVILRLQDTTRGPGYWHQMAIDALEKARIEGALNQDDLIKELLQMRGERAGR